MPSVGYLFGKQHVQPVVTPPVFILTATVTEATALRRAVAALTPVPPVVAIGIGGGRPRPMLRGVRLVIVAGLVTALDPSLRVGEIVLDDPAHLLPADLPLRRGSTHTQPRVPATAEGKARCFVSTSAAAIDSQQDIAFAWARQAGAGCVGVGAVVEPAFEDQDEGLLRCRNELGQFMPLPLVAGLLRRPGRLRSIAEQNQRAAVAFAHLAVAVRAVVEAAPPPPQAGISPAASRLGEPTGRRYTVTQ